MTTDIQKEIEKIEKEIVFEESRCRLENKELFEKRFFPADFICEGIDQTRGWFYTLHAIATMLFDWR